MSVTYMHKFLSIFPSNTIVRVPFERKWMFEDIKYTNGSLKMHLEVPCQFVGTKCTFYLLLLLNFPGCQKKLPW
jgi:hypothetical protein